jgi:hypothetical protein
MLVFDGIICVWFGLRNLKALHERATFHSLMYYRLGVLVGISLFLYGAPHILIPEGQRTFVGVFFILAAIPLFWGLMYGLRSSLILLGFEKREKIIISALSAIITLFVMFHFFAIPKPELVAGIVVRHVPHPFDVIFSILLAVVTFLPSIVFFMQKVQSSKARIKKMLFAVALLCGGGGGLGIVVFHSSLALILASHFVLFFAFVIIGFIFLVDTVMPD